MKEAENLESHQDLLGEPESLWYKMIITTLYYLRTLNIPRGGFVNGLKIMELEMLVQLLFDRILRRNVLQWLCVMSCLVMTPCYYPNLYNVNSNNNTYS